MPMQPPRAHVVQEFVTQPVSLDHTFVERVGDAVSIGYLPQIGEHGLELAEERNQAEVLNLLVNVGLYLRVRVRAAIMQSVGTESITAAPQDPVQVGGRNGHV